ncbi:MAG: winged helix-turn-helix transcriptional regulator [Bacteroides sp.]
MKKFESFCPVRDILDRLGDKWSVLVILMLEKNDVVRFSELARSIPDISQKMLTVTLRNLEGMNLVKRTIYPEVPPRVEYSLTKLGISLLVPMHLMIDWALEHKEECLGTTVE